jgi:hypothetical protein
MIVPSQFFRGIFIFLFTFIAAQAMAQRTYFISGRVLDASTKEPLAYATVGAPGTNFGTRTDDDGFYTLRTTTKVPEIKVTYVGYVPAVIPVTFDSVSIKVNVLLEAQTQQLKEVVIKPKKYRNKNNPAVELIKLVVENRDRNRVENMNTFQEEQYEKIMLGVSNLSEKTKNRKMLKQWKFALDNVDTTKLKGEGIIPAYMQENIQDFYSQTDPKRRRTVVRGTKQVLFPIMDQDGIDRYVRYLYQDVNIYDNFVVLLTDHFISPIANNAELFYRYYPADTSVVNGSKVVRLQFFPRNKTDMLLQGELFVALDSTYPVTKINFIVSPTVNLNWARYVEVTQEFEKIPGTGKWVLSEENLSLDLGLTKRSVGTFGQRYISHRNTKIGDVLPEKVFDGFGEKIVLDGAAQKDDNYWLESRHTALNAVEAATYKNIDSLQRTKLFVNSSKILFTLAMGHYKPGGGIEIGRINSFYSFNSVEGDRVRFGGRTNPEFSKRVQLEGFGAYGFKDDRFKFGVGANISLSKRPYNAFPYNLLRVNYQHDMMVPGVVPVGAFAANNLGTSFTRGTNDRFFFQKRLYLQYEKEYQNNLSFMLGFEHREISPQGSLRFVPTDDIQPLDAPITTAKPFFQVRYAPGEEFYQTKNGWRQRIRFNFVGVARYSRGISGLAGSQYDFHEVFLSAYKFTNTYPIGYNYCYLEASGIFGKVPYPLLAVHRGNQTLAYRFMTYNMMNFMEFVSDRYISLNMEQSFYGFFTNKIPLIKKLKLRELATIKVIYGQVSDRNQPTTGSGLYKFPTYADGTPLTYTLESKPYVEAGVGIANIFKVLRVELIRRFTYLDHPQTNKYGVRLTGVLQF